MQENETELDNSQNIQDSSVEEQSSESDTQSEEGGDVEVLKEQNKKLFARAKKAEELLKTSKTEAKEKSEIKTETSGMSLKDIRALQDVSDEDVDEVIDFAKYKGITIAEAKKNPIIVTLLRTKSEERKTALATHTGPAKRGSSKVTDEVLAEKFFSNEDATEEDRVKIVQAHFAKMKAQQ